MAEKDTAVTLRPIDDWHEDHGAVLWWRIEDGELVGEPPWVGTPLCDDWPIWNDNEPYYNAWCALPEVTL
jgi:hypothetical protein